jgi:hypothetical protein
MSGSSVILHSEGFEQAVRNLGGEIRQIDQAVLNLGGELERNQHHTHNALDRFENLVNQLTSSLDRFVVCQGMLAENEIRRRDGKQLAYSEEEFAAHFPEIYPNPVVIPESKPEVVEDLSRLGTVDGLYIKYGC